METLYNKNQRFWLTLATILALLMFAAGALFVGYTATTSDDTLKRDCIAQHGNWSYGACSFKQG